ncbi:Putative cytochrome c, class III family protein [Desulfonema limicola]|uniref:Cytochrome c, class III family protein n=1 Tax=Desulfonema limicola TaxID=45656 RepID=A0A975GH52_9BACT|nr:cytochrome c3 family protein [Desulfonema limicola]QTA81045.1 Putative cytochrome c, class III family protein [Desulfonema limicola]
MKNRSLVLAVLTAFIAVFFMAAGIYAGTKVDDVIKLEEPSYKHTKGIVEFSHKKHSADYKIGCGECHHDKDGKPLAELKEGDDVQRCAECHKKPGELKGKKAEGLSDKEKLDYHANALHDNCISCHKDFNKETKTKKAPTTCTKCHPKTAK